MSGAASSAARRRTVGSTSASAPASAPSSSPRPRSSAPRAAARHGGVVVSQRPASGVGVTPVAGEHDDAAGARPASLHDAVEDDERAHDQGRRHDRQHGAEHDAQGSRADQGREPLPPRGRPVAADRAMLHRLDGGRPPRQGQPALGHGPPSGRLAVVDGHEEEHGCSCHHEGPDRHRRGRHVETIVTPAPPAPPGTTPMPRRRWWIPFIVRGGAAVGRRDRRVLRRGSLCRLRTG